MKLQFWFGLWAPDLKVAAGHFYQPKIALCFLVCVCVCVCDCPQISRALSYVIPLLCHYSHERSGS